MQDHNQIIKIVMLYSEHLKNKNVKLKINKLRNNNIKCKWKIRVCTNIYFTLFPVHTSKFCIFNTFPQIVLFPIYLFEIPYWPLYVLYDMSSLPLILFYRNCSRISLNWKTLVSNCLFPLGYTRLIMPTLFL